MLAVFYPEAAVLEWFVIALMVVSFALLVAHEVFQRRQVKQDCSHSHEPVICDEPLEWAARRVLVAAEHEYKTRAEWSCELADGTALKTSQLALEAAVVDWMRLRKTLPTRAELLARRRAKYPQSESGETGIADEITRKERMPV